jgi:hypothetical protein
MLNLKWPDGTDEWSVLHPNQGLRDAEVRRHALPNVLFPAMTLAL